MTSTTKSKQRSLSNALLNAYNYGEKELSLKEQAKIVDDFLELIYGMLYSQFPDLQLWTSGSVIFNDFSIGINEKVRKEFLTKKQIEELIIKCSGCGRRNDSQMIQWNRLKFF